MKKYFLGLTSLCMLSCAQSTIVFDPVNNKASTASTAPTQGTLTLNVNLTTQGANHQNQSFSALLLQDGVLKASLRQNGSAATNATGQASVQMNAVDASNCTLGATPAVLPNGSYDLYFAINYNAQAIYTVYPTVCGAPGFLVSIPANLYGLRGMVNINGDSTYSVIDSVVNLGRIHTIQLAGTTPVSKNFACIITDPSATSPTTTHGIAAYNGSTNGSGDGSTSSAAGQVIYLPAGTYKYFCYIDANGNAAYSDSGVDRVATGNLTINGANTTYLTSGNFTAVP